MKKRNEKSFWSSTLAVFVTMILAFATATPDNALADDIDIYSLPSTAASAPNLIFMLDSTSNWNRNNQAWESIAVYAKCLTNTAVANITTQCQDLVNDVFYPGASAALKRPWQTNPTSVSLKQGQVEIRTMKHVINFLICNGATNALKANVGISFLSVPSAIINFAVTPLSGKSTDAAIVSSCGRINTEMTKMDTSFGGGNPYQTSANSDYGGPMFELFKYFGGYTNPTGAKAAPETSGSPVSSTGYGTTRWSSPNALDDVAAFTDVGKTTYNPPANAGGLCARNYIVVVSNGGTKANGSGPASFTGLGYTPPVIPGGSSIGADQWSYFLANTDVIASNGRQSVFTYTIDVFNSAQDVTQSALLKSMAKQGGVGPSGYFSTDGDLYALGNAFANILTNAAAVDSVFTATSLPVSTTTQGSFLNQLFIGMFRPDGNARPGWPGNLKQYQLAFDAAQGVTVVDATSASAIDLTTGFFKATSKSFWSNDSLFFTNYPIGTPASVSDAPDGAVVDKGGAAQKLRKNFETSTQEAARKLLTIPYTATSQASTGFPTLATSIVGTDNTGASSVSLTSSEIDWLRGNDNATGNGAENFAGTSDANGTVAVRPSIHGDIVHSRPVALNYGKDSSNKDNVVVFYGTNDGLLHAIDGRQTSSTAGSEYWSFLSPESYGVVKRERNGLPEVLLPTNTNTGALNTAPSGSTAEARRYGMDGPIGVFASYNSTGTLTKGVIYTAMRRGGSAIYAFDVTATPAGTNPALVWTARANMANFSLMGQSWSMPRAVVLNRATYGNTSNVIAVFGAGYNPEEDDPSITITSNKGKAIYVVDAFTGARRLEITGSGVNAIGGSVVGDVTVVDANLDGQYDRMYFADVKGGVYRVDMVTTGFSNWTVKKIAQLPGKIFHAPDVVVTKDFVAVFVGTGDREKPLITSTSDGFYMIKDTLPSQSDRSGILGASDLKQISIVSNTGVVSAATNTTTQDNGCYISLATNGEKVINTPLTVAGTTFFGTNKPLPAAANSCTGSLGEARSYRFPLFCSQATSSVVSSGGYPPSPVGGLVNIGGQVVPFVIGGGTGKSAFESERPKPPIEPVRKRNFYRVLPSGSGSK